jgi:uncharacterized protein Yka (UPF0111/DUF47 family)
MIYMRCNLFAIVIIALFISCSPAFADDKSQVIEIETSLRAIDSPVLKLNKEIDSKLDRLCQNTSDWQCLKKHSKLFSKLFDRAYETNLKAVNKCYDLTQEVKRRKISVSTRSKLVEAISALSLRYGYFEDAASFAQEAFDQLGANNIKGFTDNMDQFSARSKRVKPEYTKAMSILSELNASLGIVPAQK